MRLALAYILTPLFYIHYGLMIAIFHPVQVISYNLFGDNARRKAVDVFNFLLVYGLYILGCKIKFSGFNKIPQNRPIIIISNHQSAFDIPPVGYGFRKYYAKFISKIELGNNIPSVSYNLKKGKSALIDRKSGSQSVKEIFRVGKLIQEHNYAVCIFPEGTRSKTGKVKKFMPAGINTLLRAAPDAVIIPFAISGHSKLLSKGMFPLIPGQNIQYTVLDPIEPKGKDIEEVVSLSRDRIIQKLEEIENQN